MTSPDYANYTQFGLQDDGARFTWAGWLIAVSLCTVVGDSFILYASIKNSAFKLHGAIVVFIEHIAVCNIMLSIFSLLPTIGSLIANEWVFGSTLCIARVFVSYFGYTANLQLICSMTTCKVIILKFPTKSRNLSRKHAQVICTALWTFAFLCAVTSVTAGRNGIIFDYRIYSCDFRYSLEQFHLKLMTLIAHISFIFLTNFTIFISTTALLCHLRDARKVAARCGATVPTQGLVTVILTAFFYSISTLPYTVFHLLNDVFRDTAFAVTLSHSFYRIAYALLWFNLPVNFFIYSQSVKSFRQFLIAKLKILQSLLNI